MAAVIARADDDQNDAAFQVRVPSREQSGRTEAPAAADLVGICECLNDPVSMTRQEVRVTLGYMTFVLSAELDIASCTGFR
jgi:hypothetical protein